MLVLGIDSSTSQASVAVGSEKGIVASAMVSRGASHNEFLLPAIRFCLDESRLGFRNLGGIAVTTGPGLFTGMRVGVATAKALAQSLAIPIVGMPSLDLLAYEVRYAPKVICAALDARRGEVFHAFYRASPGGIQRMTNYAVERPEQLVGRIASRPDDVLIVGTAPLVYPDEFDGLGPRVDIGTVSDSAPDARALVELSLPRLFREESDRLYDLKPLYLRTSAKKIQWERIRGSRSA